MMAEPLVDILSPDMADEFSMPYAKRIIDALPDENFVVRCHNCSNSVPQMQDSIYQLGAVAYALKLYSDNFYTNFGATFAMSALSLVPILILFFQRQLVEDISAQGLKG